MSVKFIVNATCSEARTGILETLHGKIKTPAFMPVGTAATVKAMLPESVKATGVDIILSNTYHLFLRPGTKLIEKLGGLHKFMNWPGPILTDSGGFQVMSLAKIRKITEEGVEFRSHIDGSKHLLSPESSIAIQHKLGSDITMIFDECAPYPISCEEAKKSMELSLRWAQRSKNAYIQRKGYGLFAIVQGSTYKQLRIESAVRLQSMDFDGYAVGGLAVGEGRELMFEVLDYTSDNLPKNKARYLMGVGKPPDIIGAVARGIDMFDCVLPTRSGRNGQAFTWSGPVNIRNAAYSDDPTPLDENCLCPACQNYSKAYLNHLVKSGEILGSMLMTWHNLQFYQDMMQRIRDSIVKGCFDKFAKDFLESYEGDFSYF